MNKNQIKSKVQAEALNTVREENRAIVVAATGVGKSKIAIDYAKEIIKSNKKAKVLIIVPTEKLRDENWLEEFDKWNAKTIWNKNVQRFCYASANKIKDQDFDLVIMDEIHNITKNNSLFFSQNNVDKCLGLTATPPENKEKKLILKSLGFKITYQLGLDLAVELGLVSPYDITVIEVDLETDKKTVTSGTKDKPFMQTERAKYNYLDGIVQRLMYAGTVSAKNSLKFKLLERMRFIYNLQTKTEAAQYLLENVISKKERTLIFAGGIKQAEELCDNSFHSKSKKSDTSFDDFKAEKINRLSCVNALNEGHNIPNVDNGLVVQLNSRELNLIQRIGRTIRFKKGHKATIYIICALGTQDEKWVAKALTNLDSSAITYVRYKNLVGGSATL